MNDFVLIMQKIISLLKIKFVMYGHPISFWDIGVWVLIVGILIAIICAFLGNK